MTMLTWPHTQYMQVMTCLKITQILLSFKNLEGYEPGESCPDVALMPIF